MSISKNIFRDLEINVELMMDDPSAFAAEVYDAASKLMEVLNHDNSMRNARSEIRNDADKDQGAKKVALTTFNEDANKFNDFAETVDLHVLHHTIKLMKELIRDLELTFDHRATNEMIVNSPTVVDKRLALEMYKNLRDAFESYRSFIHVVIDDSVNLVPLKAKTGNYGGTNKRQYPAFIVGKDKTPMHNYRVVARMVGITEEVNSPMDLIELLTPEMEVQVTEITL